METCRICSLERWESDTSHTPVTVHSELFPPPVETGQIKEVQYSFLPLLFWWNKSPYCLYSPLPALRGQPTAKCYPRWQLHRRMGRLQDLNPGLQFHNLMSLPMSHHCSQWATTAPMSHHCLLVKSVVTQIFIVHTVRSINWNSGQRGLESD